MSKITLPMDKQVWEPEQLMQMMLVLQTKLDALNEQVWNCSFLMEYLFEKMSEASKSKNFEELTENIAVSPAEYGEFYQTRLDTLRSQWKQAMAEKLSAGQTVPELNLDEE